MIDPTPNMVFQGTLGTAEVVLYTVPALPAGATRELIKEIILTNAAVSGDAKCYLSIITGTNPATAAAGNRIMGGRIIVLGDTIVLALTTPLVVGQSITGKSDVAGVLCATISTAKV